MWEDVRQGATRFERWGAPPPGHRVRQFFHGMALPFQLMRALWAVPSVRRFSLRVGIFQSLAILAFTAGFHRCGSEVADEAEERLERASPTASPGEVHAEVSSAEESPAKEPEQGPIERLLGRIDKQVQFWLALFGLMQIVQWGVIALSRDYHDVLSRAASLLTAIEPEDEELTPRIRLDFPWMRKKLSRRIRGMLLFLSGMPILYGLTAPLLPIRSQLLAVLIPAWSAYWLVVFTAAKSAHAWKNSDAGQPWFLRRWNWLTTRVPGFRWRFLQRYGLFWSNRTRSIFSPAAEAETQPWAFAGLALIRLLSMMPLVKCFLRPVIPVAAAHLLVAQRE